MWIDGLEIDKLRAGAVFKVDNYIFVLNKNKEIMYSFDIKYNNEEIDEDIKNVAQKHILNYNKIKDM
jgi:hypothetical protein